MCFNVSGDDRRHTQKEEGGRRLVEKRVAKVEWGTLFFLEYDVVRTTLGKIDPVVKDDASNHEDGKRATANQRQPEHLKKHDARF